MKKFFPFILLFIFLLNCSSQKAGLKDTSRDEQLEKLKKEVQKNPTNPMSHYKLALHYAGTGQTDEALNELDQALKLDSTMVPAMLQKGELLIKNGQPRDGYSLYLKSIMTEGGKPFVNQISEKLGCPYQIQELTSGNYHNAFPNFSPDGKFLIFQSNRDGNWEIYTRDMATGYEQRLTEHPAQDESPAYSPDGKMIAFTSTRDDSLHQQPAEMWREIYLMNSDGGNVTRLTNNQADDWYPSFSPNGHLLLFVSEKSDTREVAFHEKSSDIYLLDLKNNTMIQLTQNQMDNSA
ncbi:MAG: tetratricopeptide repeat protein, partial [candidate division KSB1 bacterium]|nr:tetratricopeptide repeat protein [candidate division KSB1 bacterium]